MQQQSYGAGGARRGQATKSWWVTNGLVHVRGELHERQYLLRDVVMRLAARRHRQRRQFRN